MATIVGTLIFEMAANVARLQSDMAKANQVVTGTMTGIKGAANMAKAALGALGVALSADAFVGLVKGQAEALEHMRDLAIKTGNTVEAIGALRPAVRAAGGDLDQMARGMGLLAKNMLTAADTGKGPAKAAFDELGISVADANGKLRPSADVMQDIAEKLTAMEDRTRAAALAKVLLGKSGQDLLPVLEEMARLGRQDSAISTEQAEAAHQLMMNWRSLEAQSTTLKREFTLGMLPALNSIAAAFLDTSGKSDTAGEAGRAVGQVFQWVTQVLTGAWSTVQLFGKALGTVIAFLDQLRQGNVREAINVLKEGFADIAESAAKAGERIRKIGEETAKLKPPPARTLKTSGSGAGAPVIGGEDDTELSGGDAGGTDLLTDSGDTSLPGQAKRLNRELRSMKVLGRDLGDVLDQAGLKGARSMRDLEGVMRRLLSDLLSSAGKQLLNQAGNAIGGAISSGVGSLFSGSDSGGAADLGDDLVGAFANGGTIPSGKVGLVGENGPELITGGAGGSNITPLGKLGGGGASITNHFAFSIDMRGASSDAVGAISRLQAQLPAMIEAVSLAAMKRYSTTRGMSFG